MLIVSTLWMAKGEELLTPDGHFVWPVVRLFHPNCFGKGTPPVVGVQVVFTDALARRSMNEQDLPLTYLRYDTRMIDGTLPFAIGYEKYQIAGLHVADANLLPSFGLLPRNAGKVNPHRFEGREE